MEKILYNNDRKTKYPNERTNMKSWAAVKKSWGQQKVPTYPTNHDSWAINYATSGFLFIF